MKDERGIEQKFSEYETICIYHNCGTNRPLVPSVLFEAYEKNRPFIEKRIDKLFNRRKDLIEVDDYDHRFKAKEIARRAMACCFVTDLE